MSSAIDPWEAARAQFVNDLSAEEQKLFETATLDNLLESTVAAQQEHQHQSYLRRASKKLEPLVDAISQYGKALDVFSSTYSAIALLWGSIRVLLHVRITLYQQLQAPTFVPRLKRLQIAHSFEKYFQKLVDMLERIGDVLPRCQTYQNLFLSNTRLLQLISVAYVDIIHFCWTTKKAFRKMKKSTTARWTLKLCWKDVNKEFEERVDVFRNHVKSVEKEANLLSIVENHEGWSVAASERKFKRRQQILSFLSEIRYTAKHQDVRQKRHPGSGSWFMETHEYKNWKTGAQSQCLWCYGIPTAGSGKTVLMSSVVDTLVEKNFERKSGEPIASCGELANERTADAKSAVIYHYCEFSDLRSMEPTIILGTLTRQLLETMTIPEALCQHIERCFTPPSRKAMPEELFAVLEDILPKFSQVYMLIDGLDECPANDIYTLLSLFNSLLQLDHCSSIVKMIIFSRQIGVVPQILTHYIGFEVSVDRISLDIETYIESSVRSNISYGKLEVTDIQLEKEIIEALKRGAHGMFLWVHFQLLDLCDATSVQELRTTLQNLPNGIIETYTRILEKISASRTKITLAQQVFKWIICAKRPLTLAELAEAVAFSYNDTSWSEEKIPKPSRLYEACRNLIVLNEEDNTVRLAHHTFKQLLLEQPQRQVVATFHIPLPEANIEVGETCIAYLFFSDFESQITKSNRQILPFSLLQPTKIMEQVLFPSRLNNVVAPLLCARNYLLPHSFLSHSLDLDLSKFAKVGLPPSSELRNKYALLDYVIRYWIGHTSTFHQCSARLWKSFRRLALDKNLPFDVRPWGDIDESKMNTYEGLIQWAVNAEHLPLLQLLPNGCSITDAIVVQAIRKDSLPLVEVLTMKGANPNTRSEDGMTALQWAVLRGHMTFLELLVSFGANIEALDPSGGTALTLAARHGLTPSVVQLLKMNAYIEAKDYQGYTALFLAASQGHKSTVEVLLAKGANIEAKNNYGSTILSNVVSRGDELMVKLLLAKGADINAKDQFGGTLLHQAACHRHNSVIQVFIAEGVDIEARDDSGYTVLQLAAYRGYELVVEALLMNGADIEAKDRFGNTALHLVARRGFKSVAQVLLAKRADTEARDRNGRTALDLATDQGHGSMVEFLHANKVNIEARAHRYGIAPDSL